MFHPTPLPVSLAVSSGDYARGVYAAEGQLRLEEHALVLEYRVRDMRFRLGPVREVVLPLADVGALEWRPGFLGGLFGSRVVVRVRHLRMLEGLPGEEERRLRFRIRRADREEARQFASQARLALSGLWLRELEAE